MPGGSAAPAPGGFPPPQGPTGPPTRPQTPRTVVRSQAKVGRNAPCPCGSGKKYKKCCGAPVAV
ncbi:MAG: SEC-C metal-binding domain-containing protein [Acidobacteriota bacterium]|nr:SEC-C metal-binding domain-containing protein [Acidobacteriota bacterium]